MRFTGEVPVVKADLLGALPPEWGEDLSGVLRERIQRVRRKLVVLDDDPTGAQAISGAWVLTQWEKADLMAALRDETALFFVVSNTRSMAREEAVRVDRKIVQAVVDAAGDVDFGVLVRGDSTLRGHFPHELSAVRDTLDRDYDGIILCPFFFEGGRLTAFDVHWVTEGDRLIPAGQTEYARDRTFGYRASHLRDWVVEKTGGRVSAEDVVSVSLDVIRKEGSEGVTRVLREITNGRVAVVNAVCYRDLEVFVLGLLEAEAQGRRFLYRTAASFLKVRGGVPDRGLLRGADFGIGEGRGGLVIVGSYIEKSSAQLKAALKLDGVVGVELFVERVLSSGQISREDTKTRREGKNLRAFAALREKALSLSDTEESEAEVQRVIQEIDRALNAGRDVVVFTSRNRDRAGDLEAGRKIGEALIGIVQALSVRPRYAVVKGGNTALAVVRDGMKARRSWAMGQILPGVPVWRLGQESRFPDLPVVVFPGNVGQEGSLAEVIGVLREA